MKDLRYKLLLQFIVVSVVLLLGYTFIWVTITREQIITSSGAEVKTTAAHANTIIQKYFASKLATLTTYTAVSPHVQTKTDAEKLLDLDKDITSIAVLSSNGEEQFHTGQTSILLSPSKSHEFKVASFMGGQTYISSISRSNALDFVTIALPLKTSRGVLVAKVSIIPLEKELQSIKIGENGTIALIDKGKNAAMIDSKDVYQADNEKGEQALQFHITNTLTGWGITAQVPDSDVLKPLDRIISYAVLLFFAALLLAILLSLSLGNGIVTSFKGLKAGFENFNKGNLAFRVPVSGNDEIQDLSKSLNNMIGSIHEEYLKVDREKSAVMAEKQQAEQSFEQEKEHMKQVLSADEEKVNNGLFVEKEKVNAIMSNITDAVVLLTKNRQIMFFNKVAEDLLGHSTQEMQNKLITAAMKVYEKDTEVTWDEYAPMQDMQSRGGNVMQKEKVRLENSAISPRFVKMLTIKTNFNQSDDLGFILIMHNLDQEIELEKTEMKFVSAVTRELQTPVSILMQCFPFLKRDGANDTEKMYLTGVQTGIDQLTTLMQNFVLATKLEQNAIKPITESVDINAIIKEIIQVVTPQVQVKQQSLLYKEPEEPLPAVSVDGANLRDVLLNLLSNAIKFTPPQGTISINVHQFEGEVLVEVQDTGPGITKDILPNLFKKFYTIPDATGTDQTGSGLGLYTAKSLIELNHGKIWADSVEGKGSTFGFSLPKAATN
jgi:signal transduction histidine kinase